MKHLIWVFVLIGAPAFGAACDAAIGDWRWFNGGIVTFQPNKTLLYDGKAGGKWDCTDPAKAGLTLRWNAGFIDTMTVTGDKMTGKNQRGTVVTATRRVAKPKPAH